MPRVDAADPSGGGSKVAPGNYHFMIVSTKETTSSAGNPQLEVEFETLASSVSGVGGQKHVDYFQLKGSGSKRMWMLLVAAGLMDRAEWERRYEAGEGLDFDDRKLHGKQICATVEPHEYNGKPSSQISWGIYAPDALETKNFPKEQSAYSMYLEGKKRQQGGQGGNGNGSGSPSGAPPKEPAGGAEKGWNDLL